MKKLMILGAGPNQLPGIKKAVDMGLYVITVDNISDSIGHKYSNRFVNCSTVDRMGVLKAATELDVDGIVSFASDVAMPAVGFVVGRLGLPGVSEYVANTMVNKANLRIFQNENKLNHPQFLLAKDMDDIRKQISGLTSPLMFKPIDTSGSRGISVVWEADPKSWAMAFERAKIHSRAKTVCVEEFVSGIDVSGDGLLLNGRLEYAVLTKKFKKGFVITGHRLPTDLSVAEQERIFVEVVKTCTAIGYKNGPLDFDVRISRDSVTIVELSPRLGGNGIPMIIEHGTGVDVFSAAIRLSLGYELKLPGKAEISRNCGSLIFGSDIGGILEFISTDQELRDAVPEIFDCYINFAIGDEVSRFTHGGNSLGFVLFDCPEYSSYSSVVEKIKEHLRIEVRGTSSIHE